MVRKIFTKNCSGVHYFLTNFSYLTSLGTQSSELPGKIRNLKDFTEENSIGGILFSADFVKAFDSMDHPFLLAVLKSFGFGPQFIHWVRTIFKNAGSCVMNNGHSTTGYFPLERGTRQGDPLSAYLSYVQKHYSFRYEKMRR